MLDAKVVLPGIYEARSPAEEVGGVIVEGSGEDAAEIGMEFGPRWQGIGCEEKNMMMGNNSDDGGRAGRKWRRVETLFLKLGIGIATSAETFEYDILSFSK
jgi:hypothetical protein